jgi:hypothetical protein
MERNKYVAKVSAAATAHGRHPLTVHRKVDIPLVKPLIVQSELSRTTRSPQFDHEK